MRRNIIFTIIIVVTLLEACAVSKKATLFSSENIITVVPDSIKREAWKYDSIQIKYAIYLDTRPDAIRNLALYHFIERWMNTPYKWGGMDQNGIDCSAFIQKLLAEVYRIHIPRTSVEQFYTQRIEAFRSKDFLSEGDLVFFRTFENTTVSHVGLYLHNRKFINSSSSQGVSIGTLDDPYWSSRYVAAGRVKPGD